MYFRKLTIIIMVFGLIPVLMKGQTEHHVVPEDEEDVPRKKHHKKVNAYGTSRRCYQIGKL